MMHMKYRIVMMVLALSLLFGNMGFAVDIPNGMTLDKNLSAQALTSAKQQFVTVKQGLMAFAQQLPPDQKEAIDAAIVTIDNTLNSLDRIDVYFAQGETTMGAAYQSLYDFYKNKLTMFEEIPADQLRDAVMGILPDMLPQATTDALNTLIDQGKVQIFTGKADKCGVSVLTVYLNPQTFELIKKTTIVVATKK